MITKIGVRPYRQDANTWEADVTMFVRGEEVRRRWKSPMASRSATERWAREKAVAYLEHAVQQRKEAKKRPPVPTFAEYAERWMREYVIANQLKPTTRETYEDILRAHLVPLLGELRVDAIDTAAVQRLKAAREHLDPVTVNKILARLSTMLRVAIEWKLIETLPKIKRVKEPKREKPHYSSAEQERLLRAAEAGDPRGYIALLLGDDAGLRHGEIIALRISNIRFDDGPTGALLVTHTACNGVLTTPKSHQCRRIPLTPRLRRALLDYLPTLTSEWVVPNAHGKMCRCYNVIARLLRKVQDPIGARHGVHILRHTFATDALRHGASVRQVQALLGHAMLATTERYLHTAESELDQAILAVAERRELGDARPRAGTRSAASWRSAGEARAPRRIPRNSGPQEVE